MNHNDKYVSPLLITGNGNKYHSVKWIKLCNYILIGFKYFANEVIVKSGSMRRLAASFIYQILGIIPTYFEFHKSISVF